MYLVFIIKMKWNCRLDLSRAGKTVYCKKSPTDGVEGCKHWPFA